MTNKDRLISLLGFTPDKNSVDGELIDAGIVGSENYDASKSSSLKKCAVKLMELLLTTPDQKNENGFDIKYDRTRLIELINQYKVEVGLETKGVLRNKTYMW